MNMKDESSKARKQRLVATERLIENNVCEEQEIRPKPQRLAKKRYMVEPLELAVRVALG
jgi:hypothetical protein